MALLIWMLVQWCQRLYLSNTFPLCLCRFSSLSHTCCALFRTWILCSSLSLSLSHVAACVVAPLSHGAPPSRSRSCRRSSSLSPSILPPLCYGSPWRREVSFPRTSGLLITMEDLAFFSEALPRFDCFPFTLLRLFLAAT
ncbi:hypothetical protein RIF29_00676 [Crotalaria pallida]|uniref:Uncharacterized protein n=1 Tax=Crotalaria pallida TaxID=3830 RepID=A0AAN9P6M8_CROPI